MSAHTDETKAAVIASLLAGQSINQAAKEYHVPRSTVSRWKKEGGPQNGIQKKEIGALLLDYLRANLQALCAQAELFQDRAWLLKQPASEAAILHGVMTDKAIRLLEAMSKGQGDE